MTSTQNNATEKKTTELVGISVEKTSSVDNDTPVIVSTSADAGIDSASQNDDFVKSGGPCPP